MMDVLRYTYSPMKLIVWPNKILTMKSEPVEVDDPRLENLTEEMFRVMKDYGGVGLSAIQLGVPLKVITTWEEKLGKKVWLNAEWASEGPETRTVAEGCLSLPGFYEEVERFVKIKVTHSGGEATYDGHLAHILQHEIDHAHGIMFTDHMKAANKGRALGYAINFKKSMSRKKYS